MEKYIYIILFKITLCLWASHAHAHAIWIQVNPTAKMNQLQEVKIFYGEYASAEIEDVDKWYSDLKNLDVWLISPSQQKTKLILTDDQSHQSTAFTPTEEGTYLITTVHAAKDLGGKSKYQFSSNALVTVGKASKVDLSSLSLTVSADSKIYTLQGQVTLQVLTEGRAAPETEVIVMSDSGWSKTFKSNALGQVVFNPLWAGNYVIEASTYREKTGNWQGQDHTHLWQGSTTYIQVK